MSRYDLNWTDLASNAPDIQQLGLFLFFVCLLVDYIWFWVLFLGGYGKYKKGSAWMTWNDFGFFLGYVYVYSSDII